jgi:hypothetical protein
MGLTSCRRVTIAKTLAPGDALRSRHQAGCPVAVERAADRYTLICDAPVSNTHRVRVVRSTGRQAGFEPRPETSHYSPTGPTSHGSTRKRTARSLRVDPWRSAIPQGQSVALDLFQRTEVQIPAGAPAPIPKAQIG